MFGTMCKPLHAGMAASRGLFAAQLVAGGFTSRADVLEAKLGFGETMSDETDPKAALEGMGTRLEIHDVLFKYHAACHGVHATIDAIKTIRQEVDISADGIERIDVYVNDQYLNICGIEIPTTGLECKFSLCFCAALALMGEDTARIETFSDEKARDRELLSLARKVVLHTRPEMEMKTAEVAIQTKNGEVHRQFCDVGEPMRDLPRQWEKLVAKFHSCADPVIGRDRSKSVIATVGMLDGTSDVSALMNACS
jgi:2-methylcitrate dehydratase PrpD